MNTAKKRLQPFASVLIISICMSTTVLLLLQNTLSATYYTLVHCSLFKFTLALNSMLSFVNPLVELLPRILEALLYSFSAVQANLSIHYKCTSC
jgi:hypothetical protein